MHLRLITSAVLVMLGLMVAFGGFQSGDRVYPLGVAKVIALLDGLELPEIVFDERVATAKHWREDATTLMWSLHSEDDGEVLRLSVSASAADKGTRLKVEALPSSAQMHNLASQRPKVSPVYADLYRSALLEQVDARLNDRPFSMNNISRATARVALHALEDVREGAERSAAAYRRRQQGIINRAYANEM
jgi:hypothetical protein